MTPETPVCRVPAPWEVNPHRLTSWWDMERFSAAKFYNIGTVFGKIEHFQRAVASKGIEDEPVDWSSKTNSNTYKMLLSLRTSCAGLNLRLTLMKVDWLLNHKQLRLPGLISGLLEVGSRLHDEMQLALFFHVESAYAEFYESDKPAFGQRVADNFPSTAFDIEEAGKSLALGRGTAAVFHLMRVVEQGLCALSKRLNIAPQTNWGAYRREIKKWLDQPVTSRPTDWSELESFVSEALGDFMAVKNAWRNGTMHPAKKYTQEEAHSIFLASKALMKKLSEGLSESLKGDGENGQIGISA